MQFSLLFKLLSSSSGANSFNSLMTSTCKAEYSHFEITAGSTFNQVQITVLFNSKPSFTLCMLILTQGS